MKWINILVGFSIIGHLLPVMVHGVSFKIILASGNVSVEKNFWLRKSKFSVEFSKSFAKMTKTKRCAGHISSSGEKYFLPSFVIFLKPFLIFTWLTSNLSFGFDFYRKYD